MRAITRTSSTSSSICQPQPAIRRTQSTANKWFTCNPVKGTTTLRLFCFSHAGGSASSYRDWHQHMPNGVQVCAVQLPGRGARMAEPSITDMTTLVSAIADAIEPLLDKPYAFFGHSMGAVVAFEVSRELRRRSKRLPNQLFASACRAPQILLSRTPLHDLPKTEFCQALKDLNGTPKEALENHELMEMLEPMLRADFKIIETREYKDEAPLDLPITVFAGDNDPSAPLDLLQPWKEQTTSGFWLKRYPGDHFYLQQQQDPLLRQISDLLCMTPRMAM